MKTLKFKFNKREMYALKGMFERTVIQDDPTLSIEEKLLIAILANMYVRVHNKTALIKDTYSLTLSPPEALAFTIYFVDVHCDVYEKRLVRLIIAETDKKFL
ncbi:MAG TPA: hypothetical protein PK431_01520 [Chitinophagales bacterium]|nr:hypothetical protein [Chitinophagales bacterium]